MPLSGFDSSTRFHSYVPSWIRVEKTMAAVIQMFLSLTAGVQGAVNVGMKRNLHLQTRIAKHLEHRQTDA